MKLFGFMLIALVMGTDAKAQQLFKSIIVDIRDLVLEVDYFTTETGKHAIYLDTTSFTSSYGPFTSFQNGDNLQVGIFRLHFNADTSRVSVWVNLSPFHYSEMDLFDVPLIATSTLFEIDLDSAAIVKSNMFYKTFDHGVLGPGGRRWEQTEIFKNKVLGTSRIRIIFYKGLPAEVDNRERNMRLDVSPNPARQRLRISSEATIAEVSLYDILGREVIATSIHGTGELDISALEAGVYLLVSRGQVLKVVVE